MKTKQNGFTLIETLVVFVVIIILAGMVLALVQATTNSSNKALTKSSLERLAHALEEYRAINGAYPPVPVYPGEHAPDGGGCYEGQYFGYEFAEYDDNPGAGSDPLLANAVYPELVTSLITHGAGASEMYRFGMMAFLVPRYIGAAERSPAQFVGWDGKGPASAYRSKNYTVKSTVDQWNSNNYRRGGLTESPQDLDHARRILPYLGAKLHRNWSDSDNDWLWSVEYPEGGVVTSFGWGSLVKRRVAPGNKPYYNGYITVRDAWNRDLLYSSKPPYDSYKLWSVGADGRSDTMDDIIVGED